MTAMAEFLRRRVWVILICLIVAVGGGALIQRALPVSYSASAELLVPAGFNSNGPGAASEADNLAATYAVVLPADSQLEQLVAAAAGIPQSQVAKRLHITLATGSSLLNVTLSTPTASGAVSGLRALVTAVSGHRPATDAVAAGSLLPIHVDSAATRTSSSLKRGLALGGSIGLIIGIVAAIVWHRADPHIDDLTELREVSGCPSWKGAGSREMLSSMADLWRHSSDDRVPVALGIVGNPRHTQTDELARGFATEGSVRRVDLDAESGGPLPTDQERIVMAVERRLATSRFRAVLHQLRELEMAPSAAFLLDPEPHRWLASLHLRRWRHSDDTDQGPDGDGSADQLQHPGSSGQSTSVEVPH